jgi:hypothetical protein
MFEFVCGFLTGILGSFFVVRKQGNVRSVSVQADEVWGQTLPSRPIFIQSS